MIPEQFSGSLTLQFIQQQGWGWKPGNDSNIILEKCPYCSKDNHCYVEIHGSNDPKKNRDGLHLCQRCGKSGNLYALKQLLGLVSPEISSQKEWAAGSKKIDPLPDVEACHIALLGDEDALEYLCLVRGFSLDIIKKQKLGLTSCYFKATGANTRALVIPYLVNGNVVWAKYRTLPDPKNLSKIPKDFVTPTGWDAVLYNGEILKDGLKELVLVEGEADCIAALDKGIENICGVPGANIKKAEWIDTIDKIGVEKVYVAYDKDKVGQKAAQVLASRIGLERCFKITLPDFTVTTESGDVRSGKDLNEWFTSGGGTLEAFEKLKESATLFDVDGVSSTGNALGEFEDELDSKGAVQKYNWPLLRNEFGPIVQFDEGDCIHILAEEKVGKSKFAMNMLEYMVDTYKEDGIFICLEMTRAKQARMWVSHKAGIPDNLPNNAEEAKALTESFKSALPGLKEFVSAREGDLYFCYPKYQTVDDVIKVILDSIKRYGVKWIVLDNLQLLCDTTNKNDKNRTQYLSELSKRLAQICKEYNVQIIVVLQPNRVGEGKLTSVRNVDGASHVAKDCDAMLILNRHRVGEIDKSTFDTGAFIQTNATFGPEMLVTAGLSRYSAGGATTVYFDGATSTVYPLTEGKIKAMNKAATANVGYENQAANKNIPLASLQEALQPWQNVDGAITP